MSKNDVQLQLATLKKEYLQNILYPEMITIELKSTPKKTNDTYSVLAKGIKEFESITREYTETITLV